MTGPHADTAALRAFIDDPASLSHADQLGVALHLTRGCADCWAAVDQLPPTEPFRPSQVALREALLHLRCAESHAALASDQLLALNQVRRTPTGFARLLLAEALSVGLQDAGGGPVRDPVGRDLVARLSEDAGSHQQDLADLHSQFLVDEALVMLQEDRLQDAAQSLVSAGASARLGSGNMDLLVNLCEAHARLAWNHGDLDTAVTEYGKAVAFLGHCSGPARRFEVHGELATLHLLCGSREEAREAAEAARQALGPLYEAPNPTLATGAVLREAELTLQLGLLTCESGPPNRREIRRSTAALLAKADDFEHSTDLFTRACKDLCLARLVLFFNWPEATKHYQRAAATFHACQADGHHRTATGEGLLASILGQIRDASDDPELWTLEKLRALAQALRSRSDWSDLDLSSVTN